MGSRPASRATTPPRRNRPARDCRRPAITTGGPYRRTLLRAGPVCRTLEVLRRGQTCEEAVMTSRATTVWTAVADPPAWPPRPRTSVAAPVVITPHADPAACPAGGTGRCRVRQSTVGGRRTSPHRLAPLPDPTGQTTSPTRRSATAAVRLATGSAPSGVHPARRCAEDAKRAHWPRPPSPPARRAPSGCSGRPSRAGLPGD